MVGFSNSSSVSASSPLGKEPTDFLSECEGLTFPSWVFRLLETFSFALGNRSPAPLPASEFPRLCLFLSDLVFPESLGVGFLRWLSAASSKGGTLFLLVLPSFSFSFLTPEGGFSFVLPRRAASGFPLWRPCVIFLCSETSRLLWHPPDVFLYGKICAPCSDSSFLSPGLPPGVVLDWPPVCPERRYWGLCQASGGEQRAPGLPPGICNGPKTADEGWWMAEGTGRGRNRKTHGLKSKLEKLCGTSFFRLSSHDCEILCEAARALGVFCAFSVYYQDCTTGCWRLSSFPGSPPVSPPPPSGHPWGASENCSSQSPVPRALRF